MLATCVRANTCEASVVTTWIINPQILKLLTPLQHLHLPFFTDLGEGSFGGGKVNASRCPVSREGKHCFTKAGSSGITLAKQLPWQSSTAIQLYIYPMVAKVVSSGSNQQLDLISLKLATHSVWLKGLQVGRTVERR